MLQTISFNDVGCSNVYQNNGNILVNKVSKRVDELKYENLVNIGNALTGYLTEHSNIMETPTIKKLQPIHTDHQNDDILYKILTGDGKNGLSTFINDNFEVVLKSSKGGKNNTKKVLRHRKNRTLRNK